MQRVKSISTWAVVALKSPAMAKSRLRQHLPDRERHDLYFYMAKRVVQALQASSGIDKVLIVTGDRDVIGLGITLGVDVIRQDEDQGTAAAFSHAVERLSAREDCPERLLMVAGDLPLIGAEAIDQLLDETNSDVSIVPDLQRQGTNVLVCSPPHAIPPCFGENSFNRHIELCEGSGLNLRVIESYVLSLDIDTVEDLNILKTYLGGLSIPDDSELQALLARLKPVTHSLSNASHWQPPSEGIAYDYAHCDDWRLLAPMAAELRDSYWGRRITYSRKVFVPLTQLCRDVCHYCTFAKTPRKLEKPYLLPEEVLAIARQGAAAGCKEVLFTLGDKPELRYRHAREALAALGFDSTLAYLEHVAGLVLKETGLLPHLNPGLLAREDFLRLRKVSPSMGIMLESASERLCQPGMPHYGSPDKLPARRIETLQHAAEAKVPMTSGILIGIGETRQERVQSLLALRELHAQGGQIQEVIVQNFRAKPETKMHNAPEPDMEELLWSVAVARLILGPEMSIQVPPNLYTGDLTDLIKAGINDWGGVSPITPDHVNPEAPWPHLDNLALETERAGFDLVERLTVYPSYIEHRDDWVDPALQGPVLRLADSAGLARTGSWSAGATVEANANDLRDIPRKALRRNSIISTLTDSICQGYEPSDAEIAELFTARGSDFAYLSHCADDLRRTAVGDRVTYAVVRNINYTNICMYKCGFCAFSKGKTHEDLRGKPYLLERPELQRRVKEAWERGATEVCMQGGIHPSFTGETYLNILRAAKEAVPDIHVHAFSPLEIAHGAQTLGVPIREYLELLKANGLGSLPGTAAEVLVDEVRLQLAPDKMPTEEWLNIVGEAHRAGLPSTSTIMFGHIDNYRHWGTHLLRLRRLQQETGGITEFVPLPFVHMEAPMYLRGKARRGPTLREALLMHAVARLVLHPLIPNIQVSWTKLGPQWAKRALQSGANDLGGTLMNESISRAAGASHGQEFTPQQMEVLIQSAARTPMQRTTLYKPVNKERHRIALRAIAMQTSKIDVVSECLV